MSFTKWKLQCFHQLVDCLFLCFILTSLIFVFVLLLTVFPQKYLEEYWKSRKHCFLPKLLCRTGLLGYWYSTTVMSGRLCSITSSICMSIYQRLFTFCVSITDSLLYYYNNCMSTYDLAWLVWLVWRWECLQAFCLPIIQTVFETLRDIKSGKSSRSVALESGTSGLYLITWCLFWSLFT